MKTYAQLDPAEPRQAAGRQAPRMAELCRRFDRAPAGEVVLKLRVGEEVKLSEADFVRLSKAFFAEIEKKYL